MFDLETSKVCKRKHTEELQEKGKKVFFVQLSLSTSFFRKKIQERACLGGTSFFLFRERYYCSSFDLGRSNNSYECVYIDVGC